MLDILFEIEKDILSLIDTAEFKTMYIDYHEPYVKRIWFQHGKYRVYLHEIQPSLASDSSLFHPHPWKSAIRILRGKYEMGIGHSETNDIPKIDCKLIIGAGTAYEMVEKDGWHYVNPLDEPVYSLMVTGDLNEREMPVEPNKSFRKLTEEEIAEIRDVVRRYYRYEATK
jgi:hypothetical protein